MGEVGRTTWCPHSCLYVCSMPLTTRIHELSMSLMLLKNLQVQNLVNMNTVTDVFTEKVENRFCKTHPTEKSPVDRSVLITSYTWGWNRDWLTNNSLFLLILLPQTCLDIQPNKRPSSYQKLLSLEDNWKIILLILNMPLISCPTPEVNHSISSHLFLLNLSRRLTFLHQISAHFLSNLFLSIFSSLVALASGNSAPLYYLANLFYR